MMSQVYIRKTRDKVEFLSSDLKSDITGQNINDFGFLVRGFSTSSVFGRISFVATQEDMQRIKNHDPKIPSEYYPSNYEYYEVRMVFYTSLIPSNCYLFVDKAPELCNSRKNDTVYGIVERQVGTETVHDNTVYSNKAMYSRQDGVISLEERDRLLEERDYELNSCPSAVQSEQFLKVLQQSHKEIEFAGDVE